MPQAARGPPCPRPNRLPSPQAATRPKPSALLQRLNAASPTAGLTCSTPEALQTLLAAACRLYAARRAAGEELAPVPKNSLAATDVMITASGLLQAANLAVFELGMWQGWTGR